MKTKKYSSIYLRKEDFTQEALDLEIWKALTENLPMNTNTVEVSVVRRID